MSGPRARAESVHLPVITISAPKSKALAIGPALKKHGSVKIKNSAGIKI